MALGTSRRCYWNLGRLFGSHLGHGLLVRTHYGVNLSSGTVKWIPPVSGPGAWDTCWLNNFKFSSYLHRHNMYLVPSCPFCHIIIFCFGKNGKLHCKERHHTERAEGLGEDKPKATKVRKFIKNFCHITVHMRFSVFWCEINTVARDQRLPYPLFGRSQLTSNAFWPKNKT